MGDDHLVQAAEQVGSLIAEAMKLECAPLVDHDHGRTEKTD